MELRVSGQVRYLSLAPTRHIFLNPFMKTDDEMVLYGFGTTPFLFRQLHAGGQAPNIT